MRADMGTFLNLIAFALADYTLGGAATVVSTAWAAARLKLPYIFPIGHLDVLLNLGLQHQHCRQYSLNREFAWTQCHKAWRCVSHPKNHFPPSRC
jgi:hypothetical protein